MKMPSPSTRRWIYNVANAGLLITVGYGVFTGEQAALWGLLVNAVLGMAAANTPGHIETLNVEEN
jgi:hypothetical protein